MSGIRLVGAAVTDTPTFSLDDGAPLTEALARIVLRYTYPVLAERILLAHLHRGELDSADLCIMSAADGSKRQLEPNPREYWHTKGRAKLRFALSGHVKPKGVRFEIDSADGPKTMLRLDRGCWTFVNRRQLNALYPPGAADAALARNASGTTVLRTGVMDWADWWNHEVVRREQGQLPNEKNYLTEAEVLIRYRYGVKAVSASTLRLYKAALYRGDAERPVQTKKRKTPLR